MADMPDEEVSIINEELSPDEENYIRDIVEVFILANIGKLTASFMSRTLRTTITELPIINEVQEEAGLKPVKVPIGDIKAWSKEEADTYKKNLIERGGSYIVKDDILTFKPWMNSLKTDLVNDAREVIRQGKIYGYQPEKLRSELKNAMGDAYNNRLYVSAYCESRRAEDVTKRALYADTDINYVTWHTKKDSNVRPAHRLREGRIYLLDECPSLGEPGCRCWIYPYVPKGELLIPQYGVGEISTTNPRTIDSYEESLLDRTTEKVIIFDSKGYPIYEKEGTETHVSFTNSEIKSFKGAALTHNHPGHPLPFSKDDIEFGCYSELREVRVINSMGTWSLSRKDGANLNKEMWEDISILYDAALDYYLKRHGDRYKRDIINGTLDYDTANRTLTSMAWHSVAKDKKEINLKFTKLNK